MPLKDILVHVDDTNNCKTRLEVAVNLALEHEAHLTGLFSAQPLYVPAYLASEVGPTIQEVQDKAIEEAAGVAEGVYRKAAEAAGLSGEWRVGKGIPADVVALHGRYSDLIVVGQSDPKTDGATELPDDLVLMAGRPILVVPYAGRFPKVGERVVVAWNATREAARAVSDSLPILQRAQQVTVLAINPQGGIQGHGDVPGADIALHLARHGVKAEAAHVFAEDVDAGNMLLSRVSDASADLIVMGAYGHSRLRESILGGVSNFVLRHMTVPVLMSH